MISLQVFTQQPTVIASETAVIATQAWTVTIVSAIACALCRGWNWTKHCAGFPWKCGRTFKQCHWWLLVSTLKRINLERHSHWYMCTRLGDDEDKLLPMHDQRWRSQQFSIGKPGGLYITQIPMTYQFVVELVLHSAMQHTKLIRCRSAVVLVHNINKNVWVQENFFFFIWTKPVYTFYKFKLAQTLLKSHAPKYSSINYVALIN